MKFSGSHHCTIQHVIVRASHCYFTRLNFKEMGPLQFCLPVFLGIHRNPKQNFFFLISVLDFWNNPIYPLLSTWIRTLGGTNFGWNHRMAFLYRFKCRHLDQFFFKSHAGVKKCHFGNISEWVGMALLC